MNDGLLKNIIQLEQSIQADIAAEQRRAKDWEERELSLLEREHDHARKEFAKQQEERMHAGKAQLESESQALLQSSKQWCHQLEQLKDDSLIQELKKHLQAIVFGGDNDHPHGKS